MSEEKRVFCDYTVEQSIFVGNKEVLLGVDKKNTQEHRFMVCYSTIRKPPQHRQSRKPSSRRFRIGFGKTQNGETALSAITTTRSTASVPVSMTGAISHLAASAQRLR